MVIAGLSGRQVDAGPHSLTPDIIRLVVLTFRRRAEMHIEEVVPLGIWGEGGRERERERERE